MRNYVKRFFPDDKETLKEGKNRKKERKKNTKAEKKKFINQIRRLKKNYIVSDGKRRSCCCSHL